MKGRPTRVYFIMSRIFGSSSDAMYEYNETIKNTSYVHVKLSLAFRFNTKQANNKWRLEFENPERGWEAFYMEVLYKTSF